MKVKYSSFLGILVALVLVASFVVPARLMSPEPVSAAAEQSKMQWWPVDTPDTAAGQTNNLFSPIWNGAEAGSEIVKLLVGSNGTTMYAIYTRSPVGGAPPTWDDNTWSRVRFMMSRDGGRSWSGANYNNLVRDWLNPANPGTSPTVIVWDMAIAPDNPNIVAVAASTVVDYTDPDMDPEQRVFLSMDGGSNWENTQWPPTATSYAPADAYISAMDISMDYGARSILVGVRKGTVVANSNVLWTMKMPGYGGWNVQNSTNGTPVSTNPFDGDIIAAKFSPTFNGDSTIAVLYSGTHASVDGTFLVTGVADIAKNTTTWQTAGTHVEIKRPTDSPGASPDINVIITGMIQMPSDFSGQSASLRRFYICTDACG